MKENIRYVGLDVHAQTIAVAVAEGDIRPISLGIIPNTFDSLSKCLRKLGKPEKLRVCYEAGPCGYVLFWQLARLGVKCEVVAPTLIPMKAGDRVKTDRRDAKRLAGLYRAGELTAVWVPDAEIEALRDLTRAREATKADQLRARNRLSKFLLRSGLKYPGKKRAWTQPYMDWLGTLHFEQSAKEATFIHYVDEVKHVKERVALLDKAIDDAVANAPDDIKKVVNALRSMRGIATLTAITVVSEVGKISRFARPSQLMAYSGLIPSEHSSGERRKQGGITKAGNTHLRRVLIEAAIHYRLRPSRSYVLLRRQRGVCQEIKDISWKAQNRLNDRYKSLQSRGVHHNKVTTAVARELLGFIWSIGKIAETRQAA